MSSRTCRFTQQIVVSIALVVMAGGSVALQEPVAPPAMFELIQKDLFSAGGAFVNAWADFDADGDLDQFVGFDGQPNRLYRNDNGRFNDVAAAAGVADTRPTRAAAWGDADGDGDPDLLVGFTPMAGSSVLRLYRNDKGVFRDDTSRAGLTIASGAVRQPVWVDYDGDRDLDLFVAFRDRPNAMFRSDAGRFSDVAGPIGLADPRRTVGAVWFDYDGDRDLDVIVGNMDGDANGLFSNDRGRFTDVAEAAGVAWGGRKPNDKSNGTVRPCAGDVNNDGLVDLFFANYGTNGLFLNRGKGVFQDVSPMWGVNIDARYDTCAFGDVDNDGDLDLYVNGTITGGTQYRDYLFLNTLGGAFRDATPAEIGSPNSDHGAQWVDFDADGFLDLSLTGAQKEGMHWLLRNVSPEARRGAGLRVRVLDEDGRPASAGTEVAIRIQGSLIGKRVIDGGSGYNSQNAMPLHFAFSGMSPGAATLEVVVPRLGAPVSATFENVNLEKFKDSVLEYRLPRGTPPPR